MSIAAILDALERHGHAFDFTKNNLADDVAEAAAVGIYEYMDSQTDPDNKPWVELSPRYEEWKMRAVGGLPMGELYRKMKDPVQLKGTLDVSPDRLVQTYGTDGNDEARQEAAWFSEGDPPNRPARRFYELNDLALLHVTAVLDARFADATR